MVAKKIKLPLLNLKGEKVKDITLKEEVFGVEVSKDAIYQDIKVYHANLRQATAKTKSRDEVRGGGRKPFRQKGTGRARAGSTRSPLWVGGGNVFGPKGNQNYKLKQNRKAHQLALRSSLSMKVADGLVLIEDIKLETSKTKDLLNVLGLIKANEKTILVIGMEDEIENLVFASRNLVVLSDVIYVDQLTTYDILYNRHVVLTKNALGELEEALG